MINLILGPMWSGKTSELIRRYRRYSVAGKRCLMIKYILDMRYANIHVATHDDIKVQAVSCKNLLEADINPDEWDVICVDEIQFYQDKIEFCESMANRGIIVEACGLSGNYMREPFAGMASLISKADSVQFLTAVCMICKKDGASFTKRITKETAEVIIGGSETYIATCRQCYF